MNKKQRFYTEVKGSFITKFWTKVTKAVKHDFLELLSSRTVYPKWSMLRSLKIFFLENVLFPPVFVNMIPTGGGVCLQVSLVLSVFPHKHVLSVLIGSVLFCSVTLLKDGNKRRREGSRTDSSQRQMITGDVQVCGWA